MCNSLAGPSPACRRSRRHREESHFLRLLVSLKQVPKERDWAKLTAPSSVSLFYTNEVLSEPSHTEFIQCRTLDSPASVIGSGLPFVSSLTGNGFAVIDLPTSITEPVPSVSDSSVRRLFPLGGISDMIGWGLDALYEELPGDRGYAR